MEGKGALFTAVSLPCRRRSSSSAGFGMADGEVEYMVYCGGYQKLLRGLPRAGVSAIVVTTLPWARWKFLSLSFDLG